MTVELEKYEDFRCGWCAGGSSLKQTWKRWPVFLRIRLLQTGRFEMRGNGHKKVLDLVQELLVDLNPFTSHKSP